MKKKIKWLDLYNAIDKDINYDEEDSKLLEEMKKSEYYSLKKENPERFKTLASSLQKWMKEQKKAKQIVSIRLNTNDIDKIKIMAVNEWIPYQTLISAIIHKIADWKIELKLVGN